MTGFIADGQPFESPIGAANQGYADTPPSQSDRLGALFNENSTTEFLWRKSQRDEAANRGLLGEDVPPPLTAEQANQQYGPIGPDGKPVKITDAPMQEDAAKLVGKAKADELDREGVIDRASKAHSGIGNFTAGAAAFMADPVNLAAIFIPGLGEETALAGLGKIGMDTAGIAARSAARVAAGTTAGVVGQAPLSAIKLGLGQQEASDYDLRSAFKDVAYGAAGGAILHAGLGAIGDAWKGWRGTGARSPAPELADESAKIMNAPATEKNAAMSASVSQIVTGRPVDAEAVVNPDLQTQAIKERQLNGNGFAPGLTSGELATATEELLPQEKPQEEKPSSNVPPQVIDRYKKTVSDEAARLGIPLDDATLQRAAQNMAESHNPKLAEEPRHPETGQTYQESLEAAKNQPPTIDIKTPERQAMREKIASDIYGQGAANKDGVVHIVMGVPGAGKSSAVVDGLAKKTGSIVVDPDEVKTRIPEYKNGLGSDSVHKESTEIARSGSYSVVAKAAKNKDNIVLPVVGQDLGGLTRTVEELKNLGYDVKVTHVGVTPENSVKRVIERFKKTGRSVPLDYLQNANNEVKNVFQKIKENPSVSGHADIDNNGSQPRIVESVNHPDIEQALGGSGRGSGGDGGHAGEVASGTEEGGPVGTAGRGDDGKSGEGRSGGNADKLGYPEDAEIADLEPKVAIQPLTEEERAQLGGANQAAAVAETAYQQKLKAWTDCLAGVA